MTKNKFFPLVRLSSKFAGDKLTTHFSGEVGMYSFKIISACLLGIIGLFLQGGEMAKQPLCLADPFILWDDGKYYAYGTSHKDGILVYESFDLKDWKLVNTHGGFALHKRDTSGSQGFWAPEVYRCGKKYLMYFTRDLKISCALADSPRGPFREVNCEPMYQVPENRIDNSLFIDDDGSAYIFFNRWVKGASEVWGAALSEDMTRVREETLFRALGPEEKWETVQGRITEGPFVFKHDGKYYLSYSANSYKSRDYAIGYAVSDSPRGPYMKAAENPILRRPANFLGAGHHSFFRDRDGNLRIVFHVHYSSENIQPRRTVIGRVFFKDGKLSVGDTFLEPEMMVNRNN